MNVFKYLREILIVVVEDLARAGTLPAGLDLSNIAVQSPRLSAHGDLATNAALVLAKQAGIPARDLAAPLAARLRDNADVDMAEIAGPGFINLRLNAAFWRRQLGDIVRAGPRYGESDIGAGEAVNVEFVSANPTGPLHVGHGRGAIFGDALARLLENTGSRVTREYYVNDAGAQVDALARSVYLRYREALGETVAAFASGLYPGEYLCSVGAALAKRDGGKWLTAPEEEWLDQVREFAVAAMMAEIRADLARLDIHHDAFFSERDLRREGLVQTALETLEARGLVYTGVLEAPKGKRPEDWEARPQVLFRATRFGDDSDRPLRKSDGGWTYFAADIAYHLDKIGRGFTTMIDVWGADHGGYVNRMKAAVEAVSEGRATLDVKICTMVRVLEQGVPVRMSKRAGDFVTLSDVVEAVGKDVVRFIMLTRRNDAELDFDLARVTEQSKDNPVFYVQYAHARVRSLMRRAAAELPNLDSSPASLSGADLDRLVRAEELALIKSLTRWPNVVETAAIAHEPHRVAFYLTEMAAEFHALWATGNEDGSLRFIVPEDPALTAARLALGQGVAAVVESGLGIMGVAPAEEMR